jgi:hypothetical protein
VSLDIVQASSSPHPVADHDNALIAKQNVGAETKRPACSAHRAGPVLDIHETFQRDGLIKTARSTR